MPTWILTCANCKTAFHHAEIDTRKLADFLDPQKPKFSEAGLEVDCPRCGHRNTHRTNELFYSHSASGRA